VSLVFEFMEHDLHGLIDSNISLDVPNIKCIMMQILDGVQYLHSNGVMHRDIKGANVLLNNKGEIKIGDFGLAKKYDSHIMANYTNRVVTLWYRCPELLLGCERYTPAIDMWSVGCCFAELLTSRPVFLGDNEAEILEIIYKKCGTPSEATWPGVELLKNYTISAKHFPRKIREEFVGYSKYKKI